jgi:hypothetical protein
VTGLREGISERVFKPEIPPRNSFFFLSFRFLSIRYFSPESNRLRDTDRLKLPELKGPKAFKAL